MQWDMLCLPTSLVVLSICLHRSSNEQGEQQTTTRKCASSSAHLRAGNVQWAVFADGAADHGLVTQVQPALHSGLRLLVVPRAAVLAVVEGAEPPFL